jgi:hypothetical protein
MAPKRATVPTDVFGQKGSALDKLTGRTPAERDSGEEYGNTVLPRDRDTVSQQDRDTVLPQGHTDQEIREKLSVYLRPDQVDKLDELALEYRRRTGKRISRVEVVRRLIDASDLQMVLEG